MLTMAGSTNIGRRSLNEDCFLVDSELALAVVADGMGGHQFGEVASDIVVQTVQREIARGTPLADAIRRSHLEVLEAAEAGKGGKGMGTAVVAVTFSDLDYEVCWVGDCRAYVWDGELLQLTRDHSHVQALLTTDSIGWEEAQSSAVRNLITQAVGVSEKDKLLVGSVRGTLGAGQEMLLCSDGLNDMLSGQQIGAIMNRGTGAAERCEQLVAAALGAGGKDNTTALLVAPAAVADAKPAERPTAVTVSKLDGTVQYLTDSGWHVYDPAASGALSRDEHTVAQRERGAPEMVELEVTGVRKLTDAAGGNDVVEGDALRSGRRGIDSSGATRATLANGLALGAGAVAFIVAARWLWSNFG